MNETPAICIDCQKFMGGCTVYKAPPSYYVRQGVCPFNPPKVEKAKEKFVNPLKASKRGKK